MGSSATTGPTGSFQLAFQTQPTAASAGATLAPAVQVAIENAQGGFLATATNSVTLAIGANPSGGTLSGTTTVAAVKGVATFANLGIDKLGSGYTLVASAAGLTGATSAPFDITAPAMPNSSITAGNSYTCGLTAAGAAYCWGYAAYGELGNGTTTGSTTPVQVSGGLAFRSLSAGSFHACGVATSGAVYCWGHNAYGQLGNGTTASSSSPVLVSGSFVFQSVSAGTQHTCGVTATGAAYCWGYNGEGELGSGVAYVTNTAPVAVAGGLVFQSASAGAYHTCGVTNAGTAYCWGLNQAGEVGNGTTTIAQTPVAVSGSLTFASVSASRSASISGSLDQDLTCGVTTAGAAYCWGYNAYGELGDGTTSGPQNCPSGPCSTTPVPVSGALLFQSISAEAYYHVCGVTSAGAGHCWGLNQYGELGNGTITTSSSVPAPVSGSLVLQSVSAGGGHTCGTTSSGVYCWGYNLDGEFGNGTTTSSDVPVAGPP